MRRRLRIYDDVAQLFSIIADAPIARANLSPCSACLAHYRLYMQRRLNFITSGGTFFPNHDIFLATNQGRDASACSRSEEHTSELQSHSDLVCRLLLEKKNK